MSRKASGATPGPRPPSSPGKAASTPLAPSAQEQHTAGLAHCSSAEAAQLQQLNGDYRAKFGFHCVLAVRGPRGNGLSWTDIIRTLTRRLQHPPAFAEKEPSHSLNARIQRLTDSNKARPNREDERFFGQMRVVIDSPT